MNRIPLLFVLFGALAAPVTLTAEGLFHELFEPWPDQHASPLGTPYVHPFGFDPAFQDRDLIMDYRTGYGFDGGAADEQEFEVELEWALTKRLGVVFEAPYVGIAETGEPFRSGFGDLAALGRLVLVDRPRLILSAHLEMEFPTGDVDRGLGRGETAMAPTIAWWADLGNWWTLQGQFGPEIGLRSGETELLYRVLLAKSWQGPVLFDRACRCMHRGCGSEHSSLHSHVSYTFEDDHHNDDHDDHDHIGDAHHHDHAGHGHDHDDHSHHAPGLITLYLEFSGFSPLSEPGEATQFDMLTGLGYGLTEALEARVAIRYPLFNPAQFDTQYIFSIVRHF